MASTRKQTFISKYIIHFLEMEKKIIMNKLTVFNIFPKGNAHNENKKTK